MSDQGKRHISRRQTGIWALFAILLFSYFQCDNTNSTKVAKDQDTGSPPKAKSQSSPQLAYEEMFTGAADGDLPVVFAIHGLGSKPSNFRIVFEGMETPVKVVLPQAPTAHNNGFSWFTVRVPLRESQHTLTPDVKRAASIVCQFIDDYTEKHPSKKNPMVTGFSQGGILSFAVALTCPSSVALSIPVAGMLPADIIPKQIDLPANYPPVYALHGEADDIIPVEAGRKTATALKALGLDVQFKSYPGVVHHLTIPMQQDVFAKIKEFAMKP